MVGDRRKFISALISLDPDAIEKWASERGLAVDGIHTNEALRAHIQEEQGHRALRPLRVFENLLSFQGHFIEGGELTPTLKVKRKIVYENLPRLSKYLCE